MVRKGRKAVKNCCLTPISPVYARRTPDGLERINRRAVGVGGVTVHELPENPDACAKLQRTERDIGG